MNANQTLREQFPSLDELEDKISQRRALVGVVGLGYVGLPFAVEKGKVGFNVVGIEQNPRRAEKINQGINYIPDVDDGELAELVKSGHLKAVSDFDGVAVLWRCLSW